ncbi:MAG TPA: 2-phospho-L-lactate transferase CofD family protein, partial [Streptosporangiaceae bacterium]|nr:2-phospho-L-lactate transferase CofD family protein [Streptosporangiaceae bacterium]
MRITVPAGGVGAARFLRGLKAEAPGAEITVIGNTGDDITLFGLHVSPDLDTVMYTLGGGIDEEQGWGRAGDSRTVLTELAAYGAGPGWFGLGDLDIATHLHRTSMLAAGLPL